MKRVVTLQEDSRRGQINPNLRGSLFMQEMFCDQLGQNITKLNFKVLTLQEDLRRGQIIPKLRGSLSCRTFLHCDGGTILQLGAASNYHNWNWSVRTVDIRVYTRIHVFIYACYTCYSSCLRSPEQGESISLCNFCRGTASSFTHRDWTLHAFTHTQIGALHSPQRDLPRENWPPPATQCNGPLYTFPKGRSL